jgi:hypothetical protein
MYIYVHTFVYIGMSRYTHTHTHTQGGFQNSGENTGKERGEEGGAEGEEDVEGLKAGNHMDRESEGVAGIAGVAGPGVAEGGVVMGDHRLENIYVRTQRDTETGTHIWIYI